MTLICRPASVDIWYIHWIFVNTQKSKKQKQREKQVKRNLMSTLDFGGVLDESLFLYLDFDMNKYLKNWGNYKVLQIKLGGFNVAIIFIYGSFLAL